MPLPAPPKPIDDIATKLMDKYEPVLKKLSET